VVAVGRAEVSEPVLCRPTGHGDATQMMFRQLADMMSPLQIDTTSVDGLRPADVTVGLRAPSPESRRQHGRGRVGQP